MFLRVLADLPCFCLLPPVPAPWDRGQHGGTVGPWGRSVGPGAAVHATLCSTGAHTRTGAT